MSKNPGNYVEVGFSGKFVGQFSPISVPLYQRALMSLDVGRIWGFNGRN
jgi:hypothetical protein